MICGSAGSDAARGAMSSQAIGERQPLNKRADPGPSLLTGTVNIPIPLQTTNPGIQQCAWPSKTRDQILCWLRISTRRPRPNAHPQSRLAEIHTRSHPRFIFQLEPHAARSDRGMLTSAVNSSPVFPHSCFLLLIFHVCFKLTFNVHLTQLT